MNVFEKVIALREELEKEEDKAIGIINLQYHNELSDMPSAKSKQNRIEELMIKYCEKNEDIKDAKYRLENAIHELIEYTYIKYSGNKRKALLMYYTTKYTREDIAKELNISRNYVDTLLKIVENN